jgi:hypothetical protein
VYLHYSNVIYFGGYLNMAYKFQVGEATLSGSTKFEEVLDVAGGLKLSGVTAATASLTADSLLFRDSDGTMKQESFSDYAALIANTSAGLAAQNGQIGVNSGNGLKIDSNALVVEPANFAGAGLEDDGSDNLRISTAAAGDGLAGGGGSALSVAVSGAVVVASDKVGISGSIAGSALTFEGGADSISRLDVAVNSTSFVIASDEIQLKANVAGDGLALTSHVLSVNVDDSTIETDSDTLRLKDDGVTGAKLAPAVAGLGLAQDGSGNLDIQVSGALVIASDKVGISGSIAGDGLTFAGGADSIGALSLSIPGMAQSMTGDVADTDEFAISDAGTMKKVDFSVVRDAVFADVSGDAAIASGGALTIAAGAVEHGMLNDNIISGQSAVSAIAQADLFMVDDGPGEVKKVTFSDLEDAVFGNVSGDATVAAGGALTIANNAVEPAMINASVAGDGLTGGGGSALAVQVSGAVVLASDKVGIANSFAGAGLGPVGGANSISALNVLVDDSTIEIDSDLVRLKDDGVTGAKLAPAVAGVGLKQDGSGNLELDLNELATLGSSDLELDEDFFTIVQADGTLSQKTLMSSYATQVAGTGLTAASGILNVALDVALKADGDTLGKGMNYMADMTSDGTDVLNLPASATLSVGDVIHVKAPSDCSQARTVQINKNGSQTIDGLTSLTIESPFGAVSMVYVAADTFRLI